MTRYFNKAQHLCEDWAYKYKNYKTEKSMNQT